MSLYDANEVRKAEEKTKKIKMIILISIIVLVFMLIGIFALMILVNKKEKAKLNFVFNDKTMAKSEEAGKLFNLFENIEISEKGEVSFNAPIKEVATFFGYEAYNGNYIVASEDTNSCYVKNDQEVAIFELDTNFIKKKDITDLNSSYETCKIDSKVYKSDDKLYTDISGLERGFNARVRYDINSNTIYLYTLNYYISVLAPQEVEAQTIIQKMGYKSLDTNFSNQKAILNNLLVITNESGKYGVLSAPELEYGINLTSKNIREVLEVKYDLLLYIEQSQSFIFNSNGRWGTITKDGSTKISPNYDSLDLIDKDKQLFLASIDKVYGILNASGDEIIKVGYDKIGIDDTQFEKNGITNKYILLDELIPVCVEQKWSIYNVNGVKISDEEFDKIGCITKKSSGTIHNLVVVPECDTIIVGKRKGNKECYGCMYKSGYLYIPLSLEADDAYIKTISGKNNYYIEKNGKPNDIVGWFNGRKERILQHSNQNTPALKGAGQTDTGNDENEENTENVENIENTENVENTTNEINNLVSSQPSIENNSANSVNEIITNFQNNNDQ